MRFLSVSYRLRLASQWFPEQQMSSRPEFYWPGYKPLGFDGKRNVSRLPRSQITRQVVLKSDVTVRPFTQVMVVAGPTVPGFALVAIDFEASSYVPAGLICGL